MTASAENSAEAQDAASVIARHSDILSRQLHAMRQSLFPPEARKSLRNFTSREVADLLNIGESTVRQLAIDGEAVTPTQLDNGRKLYTLQQINELRRHLADKRPNQAHKFLPGRRKGDHLQVLAVANFKGGSAKTTTSIHLAHYLAFQGLRVLVVDLDPQASLTSMFGIQPEFDVPADKTLYPVIRCEDTVDLREVITETYFPGLDLVPGNLELMEFEHDTPRAIVEGRSRGDQMFFRRLKAALRSVDDRYDMVLIDAPPQLGYLTLSALYASTSIIVTIHPAMLDVASMNQFLAMTSDLLAVIEGAGGTIRQDFFRYLLTRHNPHDLPQVNVATLLRTLFSEHVCVTPVLETTAIANAGLEKKSLYEIERGTMNRDTLRRALDAVDAANGEIFGLIKQAWGRS